MSTADTAQRSKRHSTQTQSSLEISSCDNSPIYLMLYFRQNEHFEKTSQFVFKQGEHPWGQGLVFLPHTESRAVTHPEDNWNFMCETCPDSVLELKGTWIPPCNKLQLESWHPSGPSIPDLSGVTSLTHTLPGDSLTYLYPTALCNFMEPLKIQETWGNIYLNCWAWRDQHLQGWCRKCFPLCCGCVRSSESLKWHTITATHCDPGGSLSHTAFPLSGQIHAD